MKNLHDKWISYLVDCWNIKFEHSYIKNRDGKEWNCISLKNAYEKYCWKQNDFEKTKILLDQYSKELNDNLDKKNNKKAYDICLKILRWGGVSGNVRGGIPRPTVAWLNTQLERNTLHESISNGLNALNNEDYNKFDGNLLIMDSAATKIFSVADNDQKIVIYDGRVGAALGLIARNFLTENNIKLIPDEVKFMWGGSKSINLNRNPSTDNYRFRQLWSGNNKNQMHAKMVIEATKLISKLSCETGASSRQWEAALFMVGYDLGKNE